MSRSSIRLAANELRGVITPCAVRGVTVGDNGERVDLLELAVLGVFAAMSVWVLALGLWWTLTRGRVWTGVNGVYAQDATQYLARIRDASRHVTVSDLFVLRGTPHDYLQPAIVVSGGLVAIGVPAWLALLLWQPVAVGGVFLGTRALVHDHLHGRLGRRAALLLALFGGSIGTFQDLWLPWWTWGYVFGVLSLAAMVASLIRYEHAARTGASVWPSALLAGLSSWLHPWQGAVLALIVVGAEVVVRTQLRPAWHRPRWRALSRPASLLVAIAVPLAYYALLDHTDPAWRLAERSLAGGIAFWKVLLMLAPLLGPALLAYRVTTRSFTAAALRIWPPAALAVYLATEHGLGNEPAHALLGISVPLAILATEGIGTIRWSASTPRRTLATLAVLALTAPQAVSEFASKWRFVRPSASPISRSDWQAISYLARDPEPGGVLAGFALGRYIPAETGRRTYVGDVFWSEPHPQQRQFELKRLLAGQMPPVQARTFVANTGARFLLADCTTSADLRQELAPIIRSTHPFGCATVYELDRKENAGQPASRPARASASTVGSRGDNRDIEALFESFDPSRGPERFDDRSQLLVYHFMFGYGDRVDDRNPGCVGCSFVADHFDAVVPHLTGHDVTLVAESIAPLGELRGYKQRMGWRFPWVSSLGSDFKYDFGAAFTDEQQRKGAEYNFRHTDDPGEQAPGISAFALADGVVYHTYSTYARGVEQLMGTYGFLDLAPLGRNEEVPAAWWRRHDEYDSE